MNSIDTHTLSELEDPTLIDVREVVEFVAGHARSAINLPLSELVARANEVPQGDTVYVICESGGRSAQATEWLAAQGVDAVNVLGGTSAWRAAGLPVATEGI
ncbi:MAG: rhodanese-like domain-containing protein [Rhodoglobus sp.]